MRTTATVRPGRNRRAGVARLSTATAPGLVCRTAAYGCPGCACSPVSCESGACRCRCCCIENYPLPAVVGATGGAR